MDKYGTSASAEIRDTVAAYGRVIETLRNSGRPGLLVYAAHPPSQRKDKPGKDRRLWLDLETRTRITREFNAGLGALCRELGAGFLSLEDELLAPATGVVRSEFLRRSRTNHHLDESAVAPVLRRALERQLGLAARHVE